MVGNTKCYYVRAEEFTKLENILKIFKVIALHVFLKTNRKLTESDLAEKQKVNEVFALDIVKMV